MRKPNLFIIGVMECGTTSLHNRLHEHPAIYMSNPKEPTYFATGGNAADEQAQYLSLFSHATNEVYLGESSTGNSKIPLHTGVPERIAAINPNARLIYIMRDPIERVLSHYRHNVREGRNPVSLVDAVRIVSRLGQHRAVASLRKRIVARFGRSTEIGENEIADTVRYLRPVQLPQVERLRNLLQCDFPQWTTLYGPSDDEFTPSAIE